MGFTLFRRSSPLRPGAGDFRLEARVFYDILRVGGVSVLSSFQTVLTAVILTGFVGRYGAAALAGFAWACASSFCRSRWCSPSGRLWWCSWHACRRGSLGARQADRVGRRRPRVVDQPGDRRDRRARPGKPG